MRKQFPYRVYQKSRQRRPLLSKGQPLAVNWNTFSFLVSKTKTCSPFICPAQEPESFSSFSVSERVNRSRKVEHIDLSQIGAESAVERKRREENEREQLQFGRVPDGPMRHRVAAQISAVQDLGERPDLITLSDFCSKHKIKSQKFMMNELKVHGVVTSRTGGEVLFSEAAALDVRKRVITAQGAKSLKQREAARFRRLELQKKADLWDELVEENAHLTRENDRLASEGKALETQIQTLISEEEESKEFVEETKSKSVGLEGENRTLIEQVAALKEDLAKLKAREQKP